jgi:hypothetical protein
VKVDELSAQVALHGAALRAKAKDPLAVARFVIKDRGDVLMSDASGTITNAHDLVEDLKAAKPEMFDPPVVLTRPQPYREPRLTCDSSEMTKPNFDREFRRRFPSVHTPTRGVV